MEEAIAIMMADLSGFTAMTEVHGPEMAAMTIQRYMNLVKSSLKGESFMLERVGDQVVVVARNADDLALTALSLIQSAKKEIHFLAVHAGLHYGGALKLDDHYYGSTINLAARIAAKAKEGKVLCSKDFVDALTDKLLFRYELYGSIKFKNVLEAKEIMELLPLPQLEVNERNICPVCHMQLNQEEANFKWRHEGTLYYFCSDECNKIFQKYELFDVNLIS